MVRKFGAAAAAAVSAAVLCAGALAAAKAEDSEIKYQPLSISGLAEFGQLYGARYGGNLPQRQDWLDHMGVFVTQSASIGDNLSFDVGLGGIFQYMKREEVQATWLGTQWKAFFIGPTVADLRYGSLHGGEGFGLQFGRFTYKYNPDATNLGEYLFRSGAYPTYVLGGGYAMIGSPAAHLQGLRLNYTAGNLSADLLVLTENTMPALYDFSVAGLVGYKIGDGLLDLGAGVNLKRILPVRPSKTSRPVADNSYFVRGTTTYVGNASYYAEQASFWSRVASEDSLKGDAVSAALHAGFANRFAATADSVGTDNRAFDNNGSPKTQGWRDSVTQELPGAKYYTQKAILLMARASVDFKKLIPSDAFGHNDLRLSVEANLLGVQDYPIFYKSPMERLPITASFNLPGFRILDLISLQAEYFNSPWVNGYGALVTQNIAVPTFPLGADKQWNESEWNDISKRDNLSWSVLLRKNFARGGWASLQFARDHSRTVSVDFWAGPGLFPTEVLPTEKDWYWMFQMGFGI